MHALTDTVPTVDALVRELKGVNDWFNLGLILKVPKGKLKSFRDDSTVEAVGMMRKMFNYWLIENPGATWQDVVDALESLGNQEELITWLRGYYINIKPGLCFSYTCCQKMSLSLLLLYNYYTVLFM